jgi:hypothetical protein
VGKRKMKILKQISPYWTYIIEKGNINPETVFVSELSGILVVHREPHRLGKKKDISE